MNTSARTSAAGDHEWGVVFCGGGPAATGAIICAAQEGRLDELLARGVLIIEQGARLGPGSIGHYRITGNTRGMTFLRCLEKASPAELFDAVRKDAVTQELFRRSDSYPPLHLVGSYLERLGAVVEQILDSHPACTVARRTTVRTVRLQADGGVHVIAGPADASRTATLNATAARAVIAMGGCERPAIENVTVLPGLTLERYGSKLCHSSALIDDRLSPPPHLVDAVRETRSAVVIGGSHSAWSAAWLLIHDPAFRGPEGDPPNVTVLHRGPIRLFYASTTEARADGYTVDESLEVCEATGRVNRWGGLRADAHALARAVVGLGQESPPVRAIRLVDEPSTRRDLVCALEDAGLVVAGLGYQARLPKLMWPNGRRLEPAVTDGGLTVTRRAQLVAAGGTVVPQILAYGLGAGLDASVDNGAEPSYRGRVDAVWLYQAEVGRIVLRSLLADEGEQPCDDVAVTSPSRA